MIRTEFISGRPGSMQFARAIGLVRKTHREGGQRRLFGFHRGNNEA
jgi:hypothetical protein